MRVRRTNAERAATTRQLLIKTARQHFTERGYAATTLAEIADASGLTTGALYYHWAGKDVLLRDVVHSIYADLGRLLVDSASDDLSPFGQLLLGGREFINLCSDQRVAQLLLVDAPAALGYARWREIDDRWWLTPTIALIQRAHNDRLPEQSARHIALALLGCLTYLGREIAGDGSPEAAGVAAKTYERMLGAMLRQLSEELDP